MKWLWQKITSLKPVLNSKHVSFVKEIPNTDGTHTMNPLPLASLYVLDTSTDYFSPPVSSDSASSPFSCTSSTPTAATALNGLPVSAYDNVSAVVMTADLFASHFEVPVLLHRLIECLHTPAMIDSDATGIFINETMVNKHQLHR